MNFASYGIINAKKYPEKEFLIELRPSKGMRRALTWREFNEQTNLVANYLQTKLGVQKGDFVLHLQMNSLEWVVTFHAILRVGAVAVPLSFRFASADIKHAYDACHPKVFIMGDGFVPKVAPIQQEMKSVKSYICIGENVPAGMIPYTEVLAKSSAQDIVVEVDDDDPAELMFTSGTTGVPKPVCQAHRTLYQIGIGNALTFAQGHETVYLALYPFYHSGSFFYSFPSYLAGGTVVILLELDKPKYLLDTIYNEKVNDSWFTVPTMSDTLDAIKRGEIDVSKYDFSHVTGSIVLGAQPVPKVLLENVKNLLPFKTGNAYGLTEGGGGGTVVLYDRDVLDRPGSIGKPTFNVMARVVDDDGNDVPTGEVGELLLKGPRNMKEYFGNLEMTAKTVRDGWLYTGDLVRQDEDHYIYIVDRKKDVIIRGGENIYPIEIEDFLRRHPKIKDVALLGYPHPRYVEIAMAVIKTKPQETMTEEEVLKFCREKGLAKYKWPEKIVFADVPRNPAGKIDKPKLREMYVKPALAAMNSQT